MILVTGSTGTVGSAVVDALQASNTPFKALTRSPNKAAELKQRGVEVIVGDLSDETSLFGILEGIEKVFLLMTNTPEQPQIFESFINICKQRSIAHVVNLSGIGAEINASARISRNQGQTDRFLQNSGLPYTLLRASFFMQNLLWQAPVIKSQDAFYLPMKDASIGTIDVRDIAAVALEALVNSQSHTNKIYTLTGPELVTYQQMASTFSALLGRQISYVDIPPAQFTQSLLEAGQLQWNAEAVTEIFARVANGDFEAVTSTVKDVTGKEARTFSDFAQDFKDVFQ